MVIPVSARPNIWNSTLPAQETELADQEVDRTTTLFSYDEGQYLSEDEDGAKEQARKDTLKLQEEAMRCAQSLEDTEGLEEVAMFSDKMLSYGSGFGSFRSAPGDHFLVASSNGTQADEAEEERLVSASSATSPAWYRGDLSSHCGRGCCGSPWQPYTPTRSLLGGVEYVEEELLSAKKPWRSSSASQSSRDLVSASAVQSLLVAKLKQRSGMGGGGSSDSGTSVSSIVQEILAREISDQTAIVLQALEQAQHSSF